MALFLGSHNGEKEVLGASLNLVSLQISQKLKELDGTARDFEEAPPLETDPRFARCRMSTRIGRSRQSKRGTDHL